MSTPRYYHYRIQIVHKYSKLLLISLIDRQNIKEEITSVWNDGNTVSYDQ